MNQIARFQLSEVMLSMAREKQNPTRIVKKYILPQLKKAEKVDEKSSVASDIKKRIKEIEREFGLDPNRLINGRKIPAKRFKASLSQKIKYDNNVSLTNGDEPTTSESQQDSFILNTNVRGSYKLIFKRRYTLTPALSFTNVYHTNRDSADVLSEDSYTISPSIGSTFEHKLFNNPASILFDVSYDYQAKDRLSEKNRIFNARTTTYSIGEKFKFFKLGDTSIKFKYKDYVSYTASSNTKTNTISLNQIGVFPKSQLGIFLYQYSDIDNYNNTSSSTTTHLLRTDYIKTNIIPKFNLNAALSYTITNYDDASTSETKGTETILVSTLKITKVTSKKLKYSFGYDYTINSSRVESSDYTKHVITSNIKYKF